MAVSDQRHRTASLFGRAAAIAGLLLVVTVVAVLVVRSLPAPQPPKVPSTTRSLEVSGDAPAAAEVQLVHDALHDIAARCPPEVSPDDPASVRRDAATILSFARRHPRAAFPIDDEMGTTVSLLLVTRQPLTTCAPRVAEMVNDQLPAEYRSDRK